MQKGRNNMAWFDGTYTWKQEALDAEYPHVITEDLRTSADGTKLAVINHFADEGPLCELADPKVGEEGPAPEYERLEGTTVFYHTFTGTAAGKARKCLEAFLEAGNHKDEKSVMLFRQDPGRLFEYSYGHICAGLIRDQEALKMLLPADFDYSQDIYMIPLKRHMFRCPVCGHRTLQYRGDFMICDECHWEDDGTDDEDAPTLLGHDYTIRQWRKMYLQKKKAASGQKG